MNYEEASLISFSYHTHCSWPLTSTRDDWLPASLASATMASSAALSSAGVFSDCFCCRPPCLPTCTEEGVDSDQNTTEGRSVCQQSPNWDLISHDIEQDPPPTRDGPSTTFSQLARNAEARAARQRRCFAPPARRRRHPHHFSLH